MKGSLRRVLADSALIGCSLALTYAFVSIGILGWYGWEPNPAVLAIEIVSFVALACFGLYMLIRDVKSDLRDVKSERRK